MDLLSFLEGGRFALSLDFDKSKGLSIQLTPLSTTTPEASDTSEESASCDEVLVKSHILRSKEDDNLRVYTAGFKQDCVRKMLAGQSANGLATELLLDIGRNAPARSTLRRWRDSFMLARVEGAKLNSLKAGKALAAKVSAEAESPPVEKVEEVTPVVASDASDGELAEPVEAEFSESMKDSMIEFMTCSEPFPPEVLSREFGIPAEKLQAWKDEATPPTAEVGPVFTQNGRVDDEYREILARSFSEMIQNGHTQGNAAKQLGKSRTALVRWCERFGLSLEKQVHLSRKERMKERREEGRKAREFVLSKAAKSWFDLSRWGAETGYFPYKARSQCYQIAQKIQLGYTPSTALSVPCYKHWSAAVSLGWEIPQEA